MHQGHKAVTGTSSLQNGVLVSPGHPLRHSSWPRVPPGPASSGNSLSTAGLLFLSQRTQTQCASDHLLSKNHTISNTKICKELEVNRYL